VLGSPPSLFRVSPSSNDRAPRIAVSGNESDRIGSDLIGSNSIQSNPRHVASDPIQFNSIRFNSVRSNSILNSILNSIQSGDQGRLNSHGGIAQPTNQARRGAARHCIALHCIPYKHRPSVRTHRIGNGSSLFFFFFFFAGMSSVAARPSIVHLEVLGVQQIEEPLVLDQREQGELE